MSTFENWISNHYPEINPKLRSYLIEVESKISPGLISSAISWVLDGWELTTSPDVEQIAAAILMEARGVLFGNQDDTTKEFVRTLKLVAHKILKLNDAGDPMILDLCNEHLKVASQYERAGNTRGTMQLRAVANMLGALHQGLTEVMTVLPGEKK